MKIATLNFAWAGLPSSQFHLLIGAQACGTSPASANSGKTKHEQSQ
jgi:hypothetical protein